MKRAVIAALFAVLTIGFLSPNVGLVHAATGDFSLTNNNQYPPGTISTNLGIPNGASPSFRLTVTNLMTTDNSVVLSSSQNASGPVVKFSLTTVSFIGLITPPTDSIVTISVGANVPHGAYQITITGTSGSFSHSIIYNIKVYSIALSVDAQSNGQTDTAISSAASESKTFSVGVLVANATGNGGTNPICTPSFPCGLPVYGFQIGVTYDPTVLLPQGDPNPAATPGNLLGLYPDGASSPIQYGAQTNIGEGSGSFPSLIASNDAFTANSFSSGKVIAGLSLVSPTREAFLAGSSNPRFLLASFSFELLNKPSSPTLVSLSLSDVKFADPNGNSACSCVVSTNAGEGSVATETITNAPPVASFTATPELAGSADCTPVTGSPCSGDAIKFDASASSDPDSSSPLQYFWDFGDGARDSPAELAAGCIAPDATNCNQGAIAIHDYAASGATVPGTFTVTLRVADSDGGATGSARDASGNPLSNAQPSHATQMVLVDISPAVSFTVDKPTATRLDTVNLSITSGDADGTVVSTLVDWGDGTIHSVASAATSDSHTYSALGSDTITVTVTDNAGKTGSATATETIVDIPPTASFTESTTISLVGQSISFDGSASSDADGSIVNYAWSFGDSTTGSGATTSHIYASAGTFTVTLVVTDNDGSTASDSAGINVYSATGAQALLTHWKAKPQFHDEYLSKNPSNTLLAYGSNNGTVTVWAYVRFHIVSDTGVSSNYYTQVVQLAPGQAIDGKSDSRFTAAFTPPSTGTFTITATIYFSPSTIQPPIGNPSFQPNLPTAKSFIINVFP